MLKTIMQNHASLTRWEEHEGRKKLLAKLGVPRTKEKKALLLSLCHGVTALEKQQRSHRQGYGQ